METGNDGMSGLMARALWYASADVVALRAKRLPKPTAGFGRRAGLRDMERAAVNLPRRSRGDHMIWGRIVLRR
jgi:hypothetical protein